MPSAKNSYLILYNALSAGAWAAVLSRVLITLNTTKGVDKVFLETDVLVRYVQSAALLEVMHSLTGLVRAPLLTTLLQVLSRLFLVYGVALPYPGPVSTNPFYTTMLLAWSITEIIRYSYFVFVLLGAGVPSFLAWARYNAFFILYPLGIGSELTCVWRALGAAQAGKKSWLWGESQVGGKRADEVLVWVYWAAFAIYVPGSYVLYTHMMAQRRRVLRGKAKAQTQ